MNKSLIEIQNINGKSSLTSQYSVKPLKIVNPKTHTGTCHCVLTNYGGGFVQGDAVKLDVVCQENTSSVITSQANTRIYESDNGSCSQKFSALIKKNAFHVLLNDPLVLHKGSEFKQSSVYSLENDAVLVLVDWFSAGRTYNKETYAFNEFSSSLEVKVENKLIVKDQFQISPTKQDLQSPGSLRKTSNFVNIYVIGPEKNSKVELLEHGLKKISDKLFLDKKSKSASARINEHAFVCRYANDQILDSKELLSSFSDVFKHETLLQFNPLERKY